MGSGFLEMREPKSVMVGIWQRRQWYVIRDGRDSRDFEVEIEEDMVMNGGEVLKLCKGSGCNCSLKNSLMASMIIWLLEDVLEALSLLCMRWQIVDMTGNGLM